MVKILDQISKLAKKHNTEIYLTGGAVRDILLGLEVNDFDFTLKKNVEEISLEFSNVISGTHIELDEGNKIYRVVNNKIEYDFTALRGDSIKKDLAKRDFTINALAIPHQHFDKIKKIKNKKYKITKNILIDPYQGVNDLEDRLIRVLGPGIFESDPIRLLRAIRFKVILNFDIEKNTEKKLFNNRKMIKNSAAERIRYELIKIFETTKINKTVDYMENKLKMLSTIFPEIKKYKKLNSFFSSEINIWTHSLDMFSLYQKFSKEKIVDYFPDKKKSLLMKFVILFHEYDHLDFNKQDCEITRNVEEIFRDLKFSNKEIKYIMKLVKYNINVFSLYSDQNLTDSKIYDFFDNVEDLAPDILFLAALDYGSIKRIKEDYHKAIDFWEFINKLLRKYETMIKAIKRPLLTGEEIMEVLDLNEGPLVGKYMSKLKKYQALGKIDKKSNAISYLKKMEINKDNNN